MEEEELASTSPSAALLRDVDLRNETDVDEAVITFENGMRFIWTSGPLFFLLILLPAVVVFVVEG